MTMRKAWRMAKAKEWSEWEHTSQLCAIIGEANRDRDQHPEPFAPREFHPYRSGKKPAPLQVSAQTAFKFLMGNAGVKHTEAT